MAALLETLALAAETAINAAKSGYVITDFDFEVTFKPFHRLEDIQEKPVVWLIVVHSDDEANISRSNMTKREMAIQVGIQQGMDVNDNASIWDLIELEEQIRSTLQNLDPSGFSWTRTEVIRDERGEPYSYVGLREAGAFECFFTAYYNTILT